MLISYFRFFRAVTHAFPAFAASNVWSVYFHCSTPLRDNGANKEWSVHEALFRTGVVQLHYARELSPCKKRGGETASVRQKNSPLLAPTQAMEA